MARGDPRKLSHIFRYHWDPTTLVFPLWAVQSNSVGQRISVYLRAVPLILPAKSCTTHAPPLLCHRRFIQPTVVQIARGSGPDPACYMGRSNGGSPAEIYVGGPHNPTLKHTRGNLSTRSFNGSRVENHPQCFIAESPKSPRKEACLEVHWSKSENSNPDTLAEPRESSNEKGIPVVRSLWHRALRSDTETKQGNGTPNPRLTVARKFLSKYYWISLKCRRR